MLINVKNVGIVTFISMINAMSENLNARKVFIFQHFSVYEQLKFHIQLEPPPPPALDPRMQQVHFSIYPKSEFVHQGYSRKKHRGGGGGG